MVGCVSAAWPISSTGIGMSGREGRGPHQDRDDGRRSDRESEEEHGLVAVEGHPGVGQRVNFLWYQNYLDSEVLRTTRTAKRGVTIRRIVYWSCSLTQVAALRYSDTCGRRKSAWSHCRAISRWTSCSCPWTTDSKAKVEGWHTFCYSLDLVCSGFEVGVGHQLQESISFVDHVSAVHHNNSTGIGRFGREYRGSPDAILDGDEYTERFANCSRVRVPLLGRGEFPEGGSVELNRFWTLRDLSELVRNGKIWLCVRGPSRD